MEDLCGPQASRLGVFPNLLFPGQITVTASSPEAVRLCVPPPKAWGSSPPWRSSERPDALLANACAALAELLFVEALPASSVDLASQAHTFGLAAAVLFLRQAQEDAAADQFMLMERKARGLESLPSLVRALDTHLAHRRAGRHTSLEAYLPSLAESF